jgi:hypothetical protein
MRYLTKARIIGTGLTPPAVKSGITASNLMQQALEKALGKSQVLS